jgi:hypothetical protein
MAWEIAMNIATIGLAAVLLWGLSFSPAQAEPKADGWVRIEAKTLHIVGRLYEPTCSQAEGTNAAYAFWYRHGTGDGLVVYFDGGGACWDDATCAMARHADGDSGRRTVYKAELMSADDPARMSGIFNLTDTRNPVRDWSMVFLPYCTGDVHSGSNTAQYRNPQTGRPYTIQHRGWDNTQVVLHWMRSNVSQPARLLVTGSSAGAYGAATHYASLREMYPRGSVVFLGDAGQGVTTPDFFSKRNTNWNYRLPEKVFGRNAQLSADVDMVTRLAAHFPRDRFAQYTTTYDATQRAFYGLMGAEKSCDAWTAKMAQELGRRQDAPNFRSYLAKGETHTILRSPLFFTENSGGAAFTDWFRELVVGPPPSNSACTDCLAPLVRCDS